MGLRDITSQLPTASLPVQQVGEQLHTNHAVGCGSLGQNVVVRQYVPKDVGATKLEALIFLHAS